MDVLKTQGDYVKPWLYRILDDHQIPAHLHSNGLIILSEVGHGDEDITRTRKYLRHGDPQVRCEALKTAIALEARDKETLIIKCLLDRDELVQKQAINSLSELPALSEESVKKIIEMLKVEQPKADEELIEYCRNNILLIKALAVLKKPPFRDEIEEVLLTFIRHQCERKKIFEVFKKNTEEKLRPMISATLFTLKRLGDSETASSLKQLTQIESPFKEPIQEAADLIEQQIAESASETNE